MICAIIAEQSVLTTSLRCCLLIVALSQWLNANEYLYTTWTAGLCDTSVYPVVETNTHPPGSDQAHATMHSFNCH